MKNIKQVKPKEYTFKSLPRLLEMIEPTSKAKAYCQKLIDTLVKEGYTTDAKIVGECLKKMNGEDIPMAIMDEKHGEKKPNGKTAKRKFIVGDWITFYGDVSFKILKIEAEDNGILDYLLLNQNGHDSFYNKEYVDENARLWTIYDAKDGDVLEFGDHGRPVVGIVSYVNKTTGKVDVSCLLEDNNFKVGNYYNLDTTNPHPATKKQYDLLFQKMKEAGYEWMNGAIIKRIDEEGLNI